MSDALHEVAARAYREAGENVDAATEVLNRWIVETPELRAEVETIYALDRYMVARALVQDAERRARRAGRGEAR